MQFKYSLALVSRAAWQVKLSDYKSWPSPQEVAEIDLDWIMEVNKYLDWIRFHEDQGKIAGT